MSKAVLVVCTIHEEIHYADSELVGDFFEGADRRVSKTPFDLAKEALGKASLLRKLLEREVSLSPLFPNALPQVFHLKTAPFLIRKACFDSGEMKFRRKIIKFF